MTNRTAATRYARALLDVGVKEQLDLDQIGRDLASFAELFTTHPELEKVMLSPAVPVPRKCAAMAALTALAAPTPPVAKLLMLLADRDRLVLLADIVGAYRERLLDQQQVVRARVTTAVALSAERSGTIARTLSAATGRRVIVESAVDPTIIGGLIARIGGTVYDGSIVRQLERMKGRLTESM